MQTPYFSLGETQRLFKAFQEDYNVALESAVVNDVWGKSNGLWVMINLSNLTFELTSTGIWGWSASVAR